MPYDQVFPFLGSWFRILVLNRTSCELWAWANKAIHCQNLQVMGSPGGRAAGVAERHPDLHCVWKQGYYGNRRAWDLILRVMGRLWKTLRKGGIGSGPSGLCVLSWFYGGHKPGGHFTASQKDLVFWTLRNKVSSKRRKAIPSTEYKLHEGRNCCLCNHCPSPTWWHLAHWRCSVNTCQYSLC